MSPEIWKLLPKEMKQVITLDEFMAKIKIRNFENSPSLLSRTYRPQIDFIT